MCGFAGLFLPSGAPRTACDMDAMLASLVHRGPDGEGRFESADGGYQAGFRRLAIIDLDSSEQPLVADGGARVLMGNGEIYNYRELRSDFADYPFCTHGDMETVLAARRARGDDFIAPLNGMFALALYEETPRRLTLLRDRLGIKPLYWARTPGGGILFGSEIKALLASGLIDPAVDEDAVSAYLGHGYVPAPLTLYKGIHKVRPGHMVVVNDDGGVAERCCWHAEASGPMPASEDEAAEQLSALLSDSVRLQLRSDVPVGVLLSGGLDSGLITAFAAEHAGQPVNTFTVRFEGSSVDESPLAEAVARRYATRHTVVDVPAADIADVLPTLAWHCDEPVNDAALLPNHLIEKTLGAHVRVALNGTGGDELFAGYARYLPMPVEARYRRLPRFLRAGMIEPMASLVSPMTAWRLARADKIDGDGGGYLFDHTTYFPAPIRRLIGNRQALPEPAQRGYCAAWGRPGQTALLHADINTYLVDDLLTLLDRTSMASSVEGRVPFLDHRVVEAALSVPPALRTPGGEHKALERRIARPFLPDGVLNAPKRGFASPVPAWMRAGLADQAVALLTSDRALARGWWSADGVRRLAAQPDRHAFRLYSLLMLELTVRIHVESAPRASAPDIGLEGFIHDR